MTKLLLKYDEPYQLWYSDSILRNNYPDLLLYISANFIYENVHKFTCKVIYDNIEINKWLIENNIYILKGRDLGSRKYEISFSNETSATLFKLTWL